MKIDQRDDEIRKIYADLVDKTKPQLRRYKCVVSILSGVVFLIILGVTIQYWIMPTVAYSTSILIGGLLCSLYGALLLALRAFSSPSTLGLMCVTFPGGNPRLFVELMKARFSAIVGVYFVVAGFSLQAAAMLAFGS